MLILLRQGLGSWLLNVGTPNLEGIQEMFSIAFADSATGLRRCFLDFEPWRKLEVVALLSVCASRARVVGSGLAGVAATQDVGAR